MKFPWAKKKQDKNIRNPRLMEGQDSYIFRRSRTITGTKSPDVTASAAHRGHFKTERITLMELREHRQQILRFLTGCVLASMILGFLVVNFIVSPQVQTPQKGTRQPIIADYQKSIYHYFDDHPFERFGFLLRPDGVEAQIVRDHPEVRAVSIARDWYGGDVRFSIAFRTPLLVWKTGTKQFYVDAQGVAFNYNHFAEPTLAVTDQSGIPPDQSGVVASSRFIKFLGQIVAAVNGYGKGVVEQVIIPAATREIDLKLAGREYIIKTNTDRDPLQEAEDIANALKHFDQRGLKPEYIDVRVAHKAFYK
jgi:cell division septal protein FtsQ